jgi:hypothetical protein
MVDALYIIALGYPNKPSNAIQKHYQLFYRLFFLLGQFYQPSQEQQKIFRALIGKYPRTEHLKSYETLLAWIQRNLQSIQAPEYYVNWSSVRNLGSLEFSTTSWGPKIWAIMHDFADTYAIAAKINHSEYNALYQKFYETFQYVLPCEKCQKHYRDIFSKYPPIIKSSDPTTLQNWVIFVHDCVNLLLKKPRKKYLKQVPLLWTSTGPWQKEVYSGLAKKKKNPPPKK